MYLTLKDMEEKTLTMETDLEDKEESYYLEFSYMETYISDMNSQMEMIQSWFV